MSALTSKQEAFAQCIADGMSQADAYRASFDVSEDTKPESIHQEASRVMANVKVASRVKELRDKLEELRLWSRLDSVKTLASIDRNEEADAKPNDRVNAVKALNSMHGWDKQVIDHQSTDGSMSPAATSEAVTAALKAKYATND